MLYVVGIITREDDSEILHLFELIHNMKTDEFPLHKRDFWVQTKRYIIERIGEEIGAK